METRRLQAFVTLAEQGSYRRAADVLCMTQPALTKQIQALEQTFGFSLFLRGRHGAVLTVQGESLYVKACELLKSYDDFLHYAHEIRHGGADELAFGFGLSTFHLVPRWIKAFCEHYPRTSFSLHDLPSNVQCKMLLEATLHIGFLRLPVKPPLSYQLIKQERIVLVAPAGEPMDARDALHRYPFLQLDPQRSPCLAEQTRAFLDGQQIQAAPVTVSEDIHALLALIAGGNGVSLLPESVNNFLPAGVQLIELHGFSASWQIGMVWNPMVPHARRDAFLQRVMSGEGMFSR